MTDKKEERILVFCAHSDDQIFGPGGTLTKYAAEGKVIHTYVFSYGESSHPHIKRKVTVEMRVNESIKANKIIGGNSVIFFGLTEGKIPDEIKTKNLKEKITNIILEEKPSKIFTHAPDDPHFDHRAVFNVINEAYETTKIDSDLYIFDVWSLARFIHRENPKLVVDISDTFDKKIAALKAFESQWVAMLVLLWSVYARAIINGLKYGCDYAEVFYKVR